MSNAHDRDESTAAQRVQAALADGDVHSGEALARASGVSRAAVWKAVERLRELGHEIDAVPGRGYRATMPHAPLSARAIRDYACVSPAIELSVHQELDSTNAQLRRDPPAGGTEGVCFAERQTAGRGRLGRDWASPPGGLYFSVSWPYRHLERGPAGLSLAVGICLAERLHALGVRGVGVKWPNDLWHEDAKLAGILVELEGDPTGACRVIVGVGINWRMGDEWRERLGRPVVGVTELRAGLDRNQVAGAAAAAVLQACDSVPHGIETLLRDRWPYHDVLSGRSVRVELPGRTVTGIARGVDADGALCVATAEGMQRLLSGDVSVRPSA